MPVYFSFRTAVKAVVERLGQSAFYSVARGLFERDRALFAVLNALEVRQHSFIHSKNDFKNVYF